MLKQVVLTVGHRMGMVRGEKKPAVLVVNGDAPCIVPGKLVKAIEIGIAVSSMTAGDLIGERDDVETTLRDTISDRLYDGYALGTARVHMGYQIKY